jgi:hypothetical protein
MTQAARLCQRCNETDVSRHGWHMKFLVRGHVLWFVVCDKCHKHIHKQRAKMRAWHQGGSA